MKQLWRSRSILRGHALLTLPSLVAICVVPFFGYRAVGPDEVVYFALAGIALAWQWRSHEFPAWKESALRDDFSASDVEEMSHRASFVLPWEAAIGAFALHTAAAGLCAFHLGPWLLGRWFAWVVPLAGSSIHIWPGDYWMQHFESVSIVPAMVIGYILSRYVPRMSLLPWVVPSTVLAERLLAFTVPAASVLSAHSLSRFQYFFDIQRSMPRWSADLVGNDVVRVAEQIGVVAPFYGALGYTLGALAQRYGVLDKLRPSPVQESDAESARVGKTME
jgi:hypothetical protein